MFFSGSDYFKSRILCLPPTYINFLELHIQYISIIWLHVLKFRYFYSYTIFAIEAPKPQGGSILYFFEWR